ncbi:hypothetical protein KIN20_021570 [Parelaphostrongylus tenuis]|nr:hypothetical protein KIN20_021570 [Parelaphostrongylus tenuis]
MFAKRIARIATSISFHNWSSSYTTLLPRPVLAQRQLSRLALSFSSKSAGNAESTEESLKFQLRKPDGNRLSGAEFLEEVKKAAQKDSEDYAIPRPAFETLLSEYDSLIEEVFEWKDKYKRSLAETENVRARGIKQIEEAKMFAIQGFCKDLLEVADILDLAVNSVKAEELESGDKALVDLHKGIVMTKTVLLKVFKRHGLQALSPIGEKFDPNLHEAVFQVPVSDETKVEPGHIMHVAKVGYLLKERPIRPAQVGVVVAS